MNPRLLLIGALMMAGCPDVVAGGEGEGEAGLAEGEGEGIAEGEGEQASEGEGAEGEGEPTGEGEGEVAEGEGEIIGDGEGEASSEGEGELISEGEGEGVAAGEGEGEGSAEGEGEGVVLPTCTLSAPRRITLTEGDTATFVLSCEEPGVVLLATDVVVPALPTGASFDPGAMRFAWTTDLDDAATTELTFISNAAHVVGPAVVDVDVADALFAANNQAIVDPLLYHREFGLPVVFVSTRPDAEAYEPTTVVVDGQQSGGQIKLRGAFSINYPKQSFTVKTDVPLDLPGIGRRDKFVLTSTFDDKAAVRQRVVYELWNELGARPDPLLPREHVRIDVNQAVVYVDGVYEGLYTMGDQVNRDRFGDSLDIDDQGNLYKAINHDANFKATLAGGGRKNDLLSGYVVRDEPAAPVNASADLRSLVDFVITSNDATFDAEIGNRVDLDDIMDWWLLVSITDAADSIGKNSYLYFSPTEQKFRAAPWDFNHSLGQAWEASHTNPTGGVGGYDGGSNALFGRLLRSAVHGPVMRSRASSRIHGGVLDIDTVLARFDDRVRLAYASALRDEVVWDDDIRNFYASVFGRNQFSTTDEELAYARSWIIERWAYFETLHP
jgi:spore coat protein H